MTENNDIDAPKERPKLPEFRKTGERQYGIVMEAHGDLQKLFHGQSDDFGNLLVRQLFLASGDKESNLDTEGAAVLITSEIDPRDPLESLLAAQMAATHIAIMRHSKKMADAEYLQQLEMHERIFNKLTRTFTTQMEALRKHRHGGKQTMTVQHVNVSDGGRAIVGNVDSGGRGSE